MVAEDYITGKGTQMHTRAFTWAIFYVFTTIVAFLLKIIMTDGGNMVEYAQLKSMHCDRQ